MKRAASRLCLSGVLLLGTWAQAPAGPARAIATPTPLETEGAEQAAQSVTPVARQIDEEAERLRQRLAARVPFAEPARDPFRFKKQKGSEPFSTVLPEKGSDPVVLKIPASPPVVVPVLIGLTEDSANGVVSRTAVLSMGDDFAIVKVGQPFLRFVVQSIGPTSIELVDVTSPTRAVTTITIR